MAQDIFATSPDVDLRKRWALMQLQQASDASPVRHPLAAVARALQGLTGGYLAGQAEAEDKAAGERWVNTLPGLGASPSPSAAPVAASPDQPTTSQPSALPRGLRNNNPLNIEAGRFAMGQPGFQGSDGRFAKFASMDHGMGAANTLLDTYQNKYGLNTVRGIVSRWAPQSENDTAGYISSVAGRMGINPDQPITPDQRQALIGAMGQFENGRPIPPTGSGQPVQVAQAGGMPPMPGMPQNTAPAGAQGFMPPVPNRSSVQIPPDVQNAIRALGSDPRTRPQALQLYMQYAKPVESVQPMTPEQRKAWGVADGISAGVDTVTGKPVFSPPQTNVNLNTAQKGQEAMNEMAVKDFQSANQSAREAQKRVPLWNAMEEATKGFTPGATAEIRMNAKKYLKDMGLIEGNDVPDAQVFEMLQKQLQIHAQPKGQGQVSNFERELFSKALPNMGMDPAALQKGISISRKLDEFDQRVAKVYRDNARKNGGVPNAVDINDEIDKLGSPLSPADMNFLNKTSEGKASAPAAPQAQEGMTATNPKTGERIILRGGKWEPLK